MQEPQKAVKGWQGIGNYSVTGCAVTASFVQKCSEVQKVLPVHYTVLPATGTACLTQSRAC